MTTSISLLLFVLSVVIYLAPSVIYLFFSHLFSLQNASLYELLLSPLIIASIIILISVLLYNSASEEKCNKKNTMTSVYYSLLTAFICFITFYLLIFFDFMLKPFMKLAEPFGNTELFRRLAIGYYLMILSWGPFIIGYFNTQKSNCILDKKVVDEYKVKVWNELNERTIKKEKMVEIKN